MAIGCFVVQRYNLERSLTYNGYDIYSPSFTKHGFKLTVLFKHLMLLTRFSDIYDFLKRWFVVLVSQNTVNLCTTVTLGKWQGDCYIQGDRYIQVNFAETVRQLKISGSCAVTAIYRAFMYRFDCNLITI